LDLAGFAKPGDRIRLYDPRSLFGAAMLDVRYRGKPLAVSLRNGFAAYVVTKSR
jgi:hypothetical protein